MTPAPRFAISSVPVVLSQTAFRPAISGAFNLLGVMPRFMRGIHLAVGSTMDAPPARGMTGGWESAGCTTVVSCLRGPAHDGGAGRLGP